MPGITLPSIPTPDLEMLRAVKAMKEIVEVREGRKPGAYEDRFVSVRELKDLVVGNEEIVYYLTTAHTHDHGSLTGRSDDDHAQYLLLAGRGGQTIADSLVVAPTAAAFEVTAAGRIGLGNAWSSSIGYDKSVAQAFLHHAYDSVWTAGSRQAALRISDFVTCPAGSYTENYNTLQVHAQIKAPAGANNSRTFYLTQWYMLRNFDDDNPPADFGTISYLDGLRFSFGHYFSNTAATPVTTTVAGLDLQPFLWTGTIGTIYGIRLASASAAATYSPTLTTAYFPIWQNEGDNITGQTGNKTRNYFNARTGFKTNDPQGVVEIEDGGTAYTQLLKITQDDENVFGLVIGNDTASLTDTDGFRVKVHNTGIVNLSAYRNTAYAELQLAGLQVSIAQGNFYIANLPAAIIDTDKFLVSDSGVIKFRTGAEVLADIGGSPSGHTHDHGNLTGREDDDHAQYVLANGTRQLTADWDAGDHRILAIFDGGTW